MCVLVERLPAPEDGGAVNDRALADPDRLFE
jgi:hypothetical protein